MQEGKGLSSLQTAMACCLLSDRFKALGFSIKNNWPKKSHSYTDQEELQTVKYRNTGEVGATPGLGKGPLSDNVLPRSVVLGQA